jgi:hypothetical protein
MCLLGTECVEKFGVEISRLSSAKVLRSFSEVIRDYRIDLESREEGLLERLRVALLDDYVRRKSKTNREYPRKSQREKIHQPKIEIASKTTKKQALALKIRATVT